MSDRQTHAMSGITSVTQMVDRPYIRTPILLGIIAVICFIAGAALVGGLFILGALWSWFGYQTKYTVVIRTSAGEIKALTDANGERVGKIIAALNDAIVFRG
ncbi:DUF6232 family protein [Deinococcus hopiensis]|uniref:DUF6232 family protein n=1 Tax=Deinococcus hopiensis TaxID=309885 RepID=UPI002481D4BA|nr:DUF6232 family protein [Deinococcus hopiensis]